MASTPISQPASERHGSATGVQQQATGMLEYARSIRRDLHTWPEIGLDLPKTRERVLEALDGLPLDITLHKTTSGIAANVDWRQARPNSDVARRYGCASHA